MKHIVLAAALSLVATQYLGATTPSWFETDSAKAISKRLDRDFSLTVEQASSFRALRGICGCTH